MRIEEKTRASALSRRPSGHAEGENQRSKRKSHRGAAMITRAEIEKGNRDSQGSIAALPVHVPQVTPVMPATQSIAPEKSVATAIGIRSTPVINGQEHPQVGLIIKEMKPLDRSRDHRGSIGRTRDGQIAIV